MTRHPANDSRLDHVTEVMRQDVRDLYHSEEHEPYDDMAIELAGNQNHGALGAILAERPSFGLRDGATDFNEDYGEHPDAFDIIRVNLVDFLIGVANEELNRLEAETARAAAEAGA